jgi:hypothetical protein
MVTLDLYLISSRETSLQRLSPTRRKSKLIILGMICLIGYDNIPISISYEVSNNDRCIISSLYYYLCVIQILLHGIIPICFIENISFVNI